MIRQSIVLFALCCTLFLEGGGWFSKPKKQESPLAEEMTSVVYHEELNFGREDRDAQEPGSPGFENVDLDVDFDEINKKHQEELQKRDEAEMRRKIALVVAAAKTTRSSYCCK